MSLHLSWRLIAIASLTLSLASCSWIFTKENPNTIVTIYNEIDETATIVTAKYGSEYTLSGNMLARYQDFDIALVKVVTVPQLAATKNLPSGSHYFYEIRDRDGILLDSFQLGPQHDDKDTIFHVGHSQYHYVTGRTPSSIIIHLPYEQMAKLSRYTPSPT